MNCEPSCPSTKLRTGLLLGLWLLAGCGSLVDARAHSGIKRLGPLGGTVESDQGVKLFLPPGALDAEVTVMMTLTLEPSAGLERVVEISPRDLSLKLPGVLTFTGVTAEKPKVAVETDGWFTAVPGRRLDTASLSAPIKHLGKFAVVSSTEECANRSDDDGDGLADCADPLCAGDSSCGLSCQTNADCACGAICVGGGCSSPNPRFCAAASDCTDVPCAVSQSRGASCGFLMCVPDGKVTTTPPKIVAACPAEADECACEACANPNECPQGTTCLPGTKKSGTVECGRNVCK